MILVDSSVWIDAFHGAENIETSKLNSVQRSSDILVIDLILLEVLMGARDDFHARRIEKELRKFLIMNVLDTEIATISARNFRLLRSHGITIRKKADIIIGTYCIENDHQLLHRDRDFAPMVEHLGLREY
jgi:predicted nucleic acid-binding protein